ncbi:FAD-binding oxidoreductase [Cryobacterium glucosi]|uniref:FAD-binding oxidoreductase n=2 Tax=Cryobacterium glucosi TaxID=1259175 RepID=A0ABY2IS74_9MICO|nr:FAD-binding oxidoreductase [Cryobacterium glucosi]
MRRRVTTGCVLPCLYPKRGTLPPGASVPSTPGRPRFQSRGWLRGGIGRDSAVYAFPTRCGGMMTPESPSDRALTDLAETMDGRLVRAYDDDWDSARAPWNLAIDQRPVAVAYPAGPEDLRRILAAARADGHRVVVQPRGHGPSGDLAGCILVRTSAFDEIVIDQKRRVARVGSGVSWGALLSRLDGSGLVALAGSNPDVSVAGHVLGGGHSWFSRWRGIAARSIRAVELVDAGGEPRRVTADSDPELLWALRGGGGLFGIVTTLEIDLYAAPDLFGGTIVFPASAAGTVFGSVAAIMADAPPELSIFFGLTNLPDIVQVPAPLRGQTIASAEVVFVGTAEDAAPLLAPLLASTPVLADETRPFTIGHLAEVAAEPTEPAATIEWTAAITSFAGGDEAGLGALARAFQEATPAGVTVLGLRALGGAIAEQGADAAAVAGRLDARFLACAGSFLTEQRPADPEAVFGPLRRALEGSTLGLTVPTFLTAGQDLTFSFPPESLERLANVKRRLDPGGIFVGNRPLGPGAAATTDTD